MSRSRTVLLVDLGPDARTLGLDLLGLDTALRTVRNPFDALLELRRDAPRAVVVNLARVGRREREFLKTVESLGGASEVVVLVPARATEGADLSGMTVIEKPFVHDRLRRLLRNGRIESTVEAPPSDVEAPEPAAPEPALPPGPPAATDPSSTPSTAPDFVHRLQALESEIAWTRSLGLRLGNLEEILRLTLERAVASVAGARGSIQFLDRTGRELTVTKAIGSGSTLLEEMVQPAAAGIAGRVLETRAPSRGGDAVPESQDLPAPLLAKLSGPYLSVPLRFGGKIFGILNVVRTEDGGEFTDDDQKCLEHLVGEAAGYILNAMDLAEKERLALIDPLTGLYNRRYFDRRYPRELRRAQRYRHPMTLLILDIDDFKSFNDRNGYLAGDEVLKEVASILRSSFRQVDVVTRWGGEEFAILLPETPKGATEEGEEPELPYAKRVLEAIRRHSFSMAEQQPGGRLTVSGGAATYPDDTQDREELQVLANRALRRAKSLGKDRICVF